MVEALKSPAQQIDPSRFNDSVAERTRWVPMKQGGASFRTHRLVQQDLNRMVFRPTFGVLLFALLFLGMGLGALWFAVAGLVSDAGAMKLGLLIPLVVGALFSAAGTYMVLNFSTPIVFDRRAGYFWKGRKNPAEVINSDELKCCTKLHDVHALQLISEFCSGDNSSYFSHELNLVLGSGERVNVFDHGNQEKAFEDAQRLAEFLGIPLWDVSEG
ncbi:hypothetical protein PDESU_06438 [Pontiella desulfatans]|uniref:Uncharacterized protein n=2 Tax=Pontiella desulfatans TaxID=2750659 RepID=A0A6C2UF53_PONDE|nr:hypothetical protein PDESU_06438 [Pontiella desulfatans]